MFGKKFWGGVALSALTVALAPPVIAQETTSTVRGSVVNAEGAPVSGASVTVTHVPTGTVSQESSQSGGQFDIRGLRVGGPYTIEVEAPNFTKQTVTDVFLTVGDSSRLVIGLQAADTEVVVTAQRRSGAPILGAGENLNRDEIQGVVSITRDIRDLARQSSLVSQNLRGDGGISIAGSNPRTNRITIDGVQAQDSFGLNTGGLPTRRGPVSIDAVQQFSVTAVPYDVINGDFIGGALDVVLRQGANDFDGSAFVNYLNEGLAGTRIGGTPIRSFITQENYGGTLRGPIIEDKLFFALSYEYFTSADTTNNGPAGLGFTNTITGPTGAPMTLANIAAVTDVLSGATGYSSPFAFGGISISKPIVDEKYTGRFDWNINEHHRASATYRYSESGVIQRTNLTSTSAGLDSMWYLTGEEDTTYAVQVNSDWTDKLSTEVRVSQRDYLRLQEPPSGQNFSDVSVCSTAVASTDSGSNPTLTCRNGTQTVGVVRFGPDQFRHANKLETQGRNAVATAVYEAGAHTLKFGAQWDQTEIFNLFVPNSDGTYYFDSVADFQAGRASSLTYRNALTNDPTDAAAAFKYSIYTGLVQDTWDVTDALTVTAGIRYDRYAIDDEPAFNVNFQNRYGFSNQETYDGRDVIMPRAAFSYEPTEKLQVSGGFGLFSGGIPDVFLSNSFSNTGVLDNTLVFQRTNTSSATSVASSGGFISETTGAVNCALTPTVCLDALNVPVNNTFGTTIPASVRAALGGSTVSPTSETNSIDPDFEIPSDWRASIALKYEVFNGWNLGFDAVAVRNQRGLAFRDLRAQRLFVNGAQALTPDGRIRYDGLSTAQRNSIPGQVVSSVNPGSSRDIQAYNQSHDDQGYGITTAISIDKEWDNGLNIGASYTRGELNEFAASARFASTASSLYGGQFASFDPNSAEFGRSQEEIQDNYKLNVGFRRNFIGDLETRFTLFGENRSGRPTTFTMNGGSSRNATFGVNRGAQIAYLPDLSGTVSQISGVGTATTTDDSYAVSSDTRVAFDSPASITNLLGQYNRFGLSGGRIADRSSYENREITRFDLQFSQELPTMFFKEHRALLTFDIANVGNLLNDDWGVVEEFAEDVRLFDVACAAADGQSTSAGVLSCNRYRISGVNTTQTVTRNTDASRWFIQVGLKYEF
ncbi:MAG: OAR protein [Caulobacteraceae bacterium]|nr:MAG: OAR protein [Caulobacteraceae bacterium]